MSVRVRVRISVSFSVTVLCLQLWRCIFLMCPAVASHEATTDGIHTYTDGLLIGRHIFQRADSDQRRPSDDVTDQPWCDSELIPAVYVTTAAINKQNQNKLSCKTGHKIMFLTSLILFDEISASST